MNKDNKSPIRIAVLVRMFPNIVQTYVLNHILSLKWAGINTLIIAEKDPVQNETHPLVLTNKLLDETLYVRVNADNIFKQIFISPFTSNGYLSVMWKILSSDIWKQRGFKYGIKALIRARALSRHGFDIVHSHSLFSSYDYLFLKDVFSIPIATTFHGLVPKNIKMLETDKIESVIQSSDAFFVNTKFARRQLTDYGCPLNKIHIIPQGTNTADFAFKPRNIASDRPINIISVGRLSIEKGFHIAVEAIAKLMKQHPDIRYHIIGGGVEEQNLTNLIHNLGIVANVEIAGSVSTDKLLSFYNEAHIFILPSIDFRDGSHTETQGVVLQEAQSSGIPVIASRTGGIPEVVIDGETGLLFDEKNVTQLSQLIEILINNSDLYQKLSYQARRDVEDNYSTNAICNRLINVYQSTLISTGRL